MPVLSGRLEWSQGLIREVGILPASGSSGHDDPFICPALFDTGAGVSCILRPVAEYLGLEPAGQKTMQTVGPAVTVDTYQVQFFFLLDQERDEDLIGAENWDPIERVLAPCFTPDGPRRYQAIVGRDILQKGVLTLSPGGQYAFGY